MGRVRDPRLTFTSIRGPLRSNGAGSARAAIAARHRKKDAKRRKDLNLEAILISYRLLRCYGFSRREPTVRVDHQIRCHGRRAQFLRNTFFGQKFARRSKKVSEYVAKIRAIQWPGRLRMA